MKNILIKISIIAVGLLALAGVAYAQISGGTGGGIGSTQFWKLNGTNLEPLNPAWAISGTGDITAVGDCASGACFNGTQGTTLTFNNVGGDGAIDYDGTDFTSDKPISLGTAGVRFTGDGDGAFTILGLGNGSDEDLTLNLDDTADTGVFSSSTGLNALTFTSIDLGTSGSRIGKIWLTDLDATSGTIGTLTVSSTVSGDLTVGGDVIVNGSDVTIGAAGVKLTGDGDGAITFLGLGDGSDEDLTLNLDDTSNVGTFTSSTLLATLNFSSIALQESGNAIPNATDHLGFFAATTSAQFAGVINDETGSGAVVLGTTPTFTTSLITPIVISAAGDPADAGVLRLGNTEIIGWENSTPGTDITLTVDASNIMQSSGTLNATTLTESTNAVPNSTDHLGFFAATTSAQLAGVISDESGSGLLVFATSPTLTTPRFADLGYIADANGNEILVLDTVATAIPYLQLSNNSTGLNPVLTGAGEANTGIDLLTSGSGTFRFLGNSTQAAEIRLLEDTDDGTNYASFKVPALAGNTAYTLPSDDGAANEFLKTDGSGVLDWTSPAGSRIHSFTTDVTVGGTGTETDLLSVSVTGGTLGTTGVLEGKIFIENLDSVTSPSTITINVKYGATTVATTAVNIATITDGGGYIEYTLLAAGATNSQEASVDFYYSVDQRLTAAGEEGHTFGSGTAAEDSTAAKTFAVSWTWTTSDAGNTVTADHGYVQKIVD